MNATKCPPGPLRESRKHLRTAIYTLSKWKKKRGGKNPNRQVRPRNRASKGEYPKIRALAAPLYLTTFVLRAPLQYRSSSPSISKILICISPKVIAPALLFVRRRLNLEKGPLRPSLPSLPPSLPQSLARRGTKGALDGGGTSSFPSQNTLGPPVSGLGYCPCLRSAAGTWDSPPLFDVALFQAL